MTVDAHGVPDGDLMVLAVQETDSSIHIYAALSSPPAPACVSAPHEQHPYGTSGSRGGQGSGGMRATSGPGITRQVPTGPTVTSGPAKDPALSANGG